MQIQLVEPKPMMKEPNDLHGLLAAAAQRPPVSCEALQAAASAAAGELPADPWARWLLVALQRYQLRGSEPRSGCHGTVSIDPHAFGTYLESAGRLQPIEAALRAFGASSRWWMADLITLRHAGLITGEHRLRVTEAGVATAAALEKILLRALESRSPLDRAWLFALAGDFVRARDAASGLGPLPGVDKRAREQLWARILRLSGPYSHGNAGDLVALAQLGRVYAEREVVTQLERTPIDGITSAALEIVGDWNDVAFTDALLSLAERADGQEAPEPNIRIRACQIVLKTLARAGAPEPMRQRLCRTLQKSQGAACAEGAMMLALVDHEAGVNALDRALKSDIPLARQDAAAGLLLLGTQAALEVINRSSAPEAHASLVAARLASFRETYADALALIRGLRVVERALRPDA